MNKTLHKILELCEAEKLNITTFKTEPTVNGNTITLVMDIDDRKCGSPDKLVPGEVRRVNL